MEQTLGMMTAMTEITRSGSKASRGLVSIQSRYNQILDESSSTGKKLTDFYTTHGIQLKDETGQLRSMYDVLGDLSSKWGGLTDDEKKYFALIQGGATQTQNLMALMSNFGTAVDATKTAMESSGSAAEENAAAMESLQKKIDNLKAAWENFATGTITKDFIGSIIDAGTRLLEFANTDLGITITKALLFGTTLGSAAGFLGTFISKIGEGISAFKKLKSGVDVATGAVGVLAKAKWTVIALGIAAVTTVVIGLIEAFKNAGDRFERFTSKAKESSDKISEYGDKISEAKDQLKELNEIPAADRSQSQEEEIARLEALISSYEKLIDAEKKEQQQSLGKATKELEKRGVRTGEFSTTLKGTTLSDLGVEYTDIADFVKTQWAGADAGKQQRIIDALTQSYGSMTEATYRYAEAIGLSTVNEKGEAKSVETLQRELQEFYGITFKEGISTVAETADSYKELADSINNTSEPSEKLLDDAKRQLDMNKELADSFKKYKDAGGELSEEQQKWLDNYLALQEAYDKGQAALDRYNLSVKTAQDTLAKFPETEQASRVAIESVSKALIDNSELGIKSADDLKTALLKLADAGEIDLSRIGNIDDFIAKLLEANNIQFDDKNINVETNADEANEKLESLDTEDENKNITISTVEEGQALEASMQRLSDWIDKINGKKVTITLNAKTTEAQNQINTLIDSINEAMVAPNIEVTTNADTVAEAMGQLESACDKVKNKSPISASVKANVQSARTQLNSIAGQMNSLNGRSASVYVTADTSQAGKNIASIVRQLQELTSKTWIVNIHANKDGSFASGTKSAPGGLALINDGVPVNGSSAELVVDDGIGQIYNNGKETVQPIPKGAKVYTARQTQDILKDRGLTVDDVSEHPITALADGTNNKKYPDYRNDPTYSGVADLTGSGEDLKKNFEEWLKEKKHWLNMDIISQSQYYRDLEIMNERYLKNLTEAKDEYWSHEEEIYKYQNQSLEEQIQLEEKLSELAKAKENKIYAFAGGRFQYLQNLDAIAKAQREVDQLTGKYANGTTNARGGLSLVGENGPEMRVLGHGDGIIPAEATKNLMALSSLNIKDALSNIGRAIVTNYSFDISRLELPSVSNAGEFLDGLKNLAYQYSYARA
nr:MAG TPA: tail tape measure protein [Caudoviricetes sp.]